MAISKAHFHCHMKGRGREGVCAWMKVAKIYAGHQKKIMEIKDCSFGGRK